MVFSVTDFVLLLVIAGTYAAACFNFALWPHLFFILALTLIFMLYRVLWYVVQVWKRVNQMPIETVAKLLNNLLGQPPQPK